MPMQGGYDANQHQPIQDVGGSHPPGRFPAKITNTVIETNKAGNGGFLKVEFTTPAGKIFNRYNLWNPNPQAVDIANKQLSTLCRATGVFRLNWEDDGAAMRNAECQIEVVPQKDKEGKDTEYTEIKTIKDRAGNDPTKVGQQQQVNAPQAGQGGWGGQPQQQQPAQQPPQQQWQQPPQQPPQGQPQGQPMQQQPNGGWGAPPNGGQAPQAQPPQQTGWSGAPQQQQTPPQQPPQGGWQQGPQGGQPQKAPWN
jgi:hypothetical protein